MSENEGITASDLIDQIVEHLQDIANAKEMENIKSMRDVYKHYEETSYKKLQEKLDDYVDQRIKAMLIKSKLITIVDPMD